MAAGARIRPLGKGKGKVRTLDIVPVRENLTPEALIEVWHALSRDFAVLVKQLNTHAFIR